MRRISRTSFQGWVWAATASVLIQGCSSAPEATVRRPSCSPTSLQVRAFDEGRAPAAGDSIEISENFRSIVAEWLLLAREAESVKENLDQALQATPSAEQPIVKTPPAVQTALARLAQIRESMRQLLGQWKQASTQSGAAPELREWMREFSLDPVFGPRISRATLELQDALTLAVQSQEGCEPSRKIASQAAWNVEAIQASPELMDLTPSELVAKVGLSSVASGALLKKRPVSARTKSATPEIDALDWIDWDGRSVLARLHRLNAFGVHGAIRLQTEQPHAVWVKERLEQESAQGTAAAPEKT